jgi:hypothetical protein
MKKYNESEHPREDIAKDRSPTETDTRHTPPSNVPLERAAYDWDHALKIATDRIWGDQAPSPRKVPRK